MYQPKLFDMVVRRVEAPPNSWKWGNKPVKVTRLINSDMFAVNDDESVGPWDRGYFDPVEETNTPNAPPSPPSALSTQIGGDHYKSLTIQPIEYITKNNLGWCEGNVIKYISRWKQKGQHADLDKVIHYVNLLKELNV